MSNWQQAVDVLFVLSNNNMIMKKIFSVLLFLVVICQIRAEDTNITTMRKMTQRLFPQQASFFDFRLLNDTSTDTFTIKSEGNKIIISGNNANSLAVGLNHYLKNYCHRVSVISGNNNFIPFTFDGKSICRSIIQQTKIKK